VTGLDSRRRYLFTLGLLIFAAAQFYFWGHTTDDAYIAFRYIERFVSGHGLTFNNGVRVEGYSSPLWAVSIYILRWLLPVPVELLARIIGILLALGTYVLAWRIVREQTESVIALVALVVVLIVSPGFLYFAGAGLESPLLQFLLVLAVWFEHREKHEVASLAFGLAAIVRPEAILYALVWLAWVWVKNLDRFALHAILTLSFVIAWEIFRLSYYETWLPNTALAKSWLGIQDLGFRQLARYIVPPFMALCALWFTRRRIQRREIPKILSLILLLISAGVIFVVYAQIDWMFFGRFVQPVAPLIAIAVALYVGSLELPRRVAVQTIALLFLAQVACWLPQCIRYYNDEGFSMLMRGTDPVMAGKWLRAHFPSDLTLATGRLGALAFTNMNRTVWDFDGLTDREQAIFNHTSQVGPSPIARRRPDIIAEVDVPASWSYRNDTTEIRELESQFELVKRFPQGNFGTMDIWLRKEQSRRIFARNDD
jgi:arabinofuranosyltransferase